MNLKLVWCLPGTEFEIPFEPMMQKLEGTWHLIILLGVTPEPQTSNLKTSNLKGEAWPGRAPQHCKPILPHVPLPVLLPRGGTRFGSPAKYNNAGLDYTGRQLHSTDCEPRLCTFVTNCPRHLT